MKPLTKYLKQNYEKFSIIIYRSCAGREDDKNSEIDLIVVGSAEKIEMTAIEKRLSRTINLLVYSYREWEEKPNH